jgi:hypothetical protein
MIYVEKLNLSRTSRIDINMVDRIDLRELIFKKIAESYLYEQDDDVEKIDAASYKNSHDTTQELFGTLKEKYIQRVTSDMYANKIRRQLKRNKYSDEEISSLLDDSEFLERISNSIENSSVMLITPQSLKKSISDLSNGVVLMSNSEKSWAPNFDNLKASILDSDKISSTLSHVKKSIDNFISQARSYDNPLILMDYEEVKDKPGKIRGIIDHELDHIQGSLAGMAGKVIKQSPDEPATFESTVKSIIKDPTEGGWDEWIIDRFKGDRRAAYDFMKDAFQENLDPKSRRGVEESRNRLRELNDALGESEQALREFLQNEMSNPTAHKELVKRYGRRIAQVIPLINYEIGIDELVAMIYGIASAKKMDSDSKIV